MAESTIKTILQLDATLAGLLTGGIHTSEALGESGLSRTSAPPGVWSTVNGLPNLNPTLVIRIPQEIYSYDYHDADSQSTSLEVPLYLWLYDSAGYTTLKSAAQLCKKLLHSKSFSNLGYVHFLNALKGEAPELDEASFLRLDFEYKTIERLGA